MDQLSIVSIKRSAPEPVPHDSNESTDLLDLRVALVQQRVFGGEVVLLAVDMHELYYRPGIMTGLDL